MRRVVARIDTGASTVGCAAQAMQGAMAGGADLSATTGCAAATTVSGIVLQVHADATTCAGSAHADHRTLTLVTDHAVRADIATGTTMIRIIGQIDTGTSTIGGAAHTTQVAATILANQASGTGCATAAAIRRIDRRIDTDLVAKAGTGARVLRFTTRPSHRDQNSNQAAHSDLHHASIRGIGVSRQVAQPVLRRSRCQTPRTAAG